MSRNLILISVYAGVRELILLLVVHSGGRKFSSTAHAGGSKPPI